MGDLGTCIIEKSRPRLSDMIKVLCMTAADQRLSSSALAHGLDLLQEELVNLGRFSGFS